ncbi:hypothetical protein GGQ99_000600 [Aminobacter niigataensis]|uniref:Glycosyltransferase RgtA/B/C/D-like domain-containing protein n=1 Tax=Aminobacter niigataensis TaxID=83265 RepID=A0ABR6KWH0_9HYPH|nr:hypothetical protein [Aminobacter niigataensis]MBB4648878.1 hypothetical protein [Aminobacter niigataensis]
MMAGDGTVMGWALRTGIVRSFTQAAGSKRLLDRLAVTFFAVVCLTISAYALVRPDYNWDMVAYVATALEDRHSDPVELHAETWRLISERASESQLYALQQGNTYNLNQWQNPADFQSQLSMYRVKVGYIAMLRTLEPVVGLVNAAMLLSILPSLALGAFCLFWLAREDALQGAFVLAPLLVLADYAHMTTAVVPDMLVSLVSFVAVYLLLRRRDLTACLLLFASVFLRPDNIILVFALLLTAIAFGWRVFPLLVTFVAALAGGMIAAKVGGHPGWWAHFYFSCVQIQNSMANFHPDFSLVDFARGYIRGAVVAVMDNEWPAIFALLLAGWALLGRAGRTGGGRENALLFALAIGTLGKFVSFPLPDDRFYFVFIGAMSMVLVTMWRPRFDIMPARA